MRTRGIVGLILTLGLVMGVIAPAPAADPSEPQEDAIGRTPPRLSFVDGQVSFWRPGAQDWAQAQINTPLAPGDQLSTGTPGNLELQIGARAFVRAWANTQLGLENQEPDFLQLKVTAGRVALDLRTLEPGDTVEVATPSAAFTIEHPGYYRVDVSGERTAFITRRAGRATVIPASGEPFAIAASEEVVLDGAASPQIRSYAAPPLDEWDKWNYARTDALLEAVSARYVAPGTYGIDDLDRYGDWRVVETYGPVWMPRGVPAGWAPYSTGSWVLDPFYGWTWVDTAPWGWAPYHYGRWVSVSGFWAWAPGPVVVRPVYAPALVAFFGGPGVQVSVGGPLVGWVALGWGEPCVPWWGRPGFVRRPWWGGWGGPRVVNNVVIHRTTVVNVEQITVYRNAHVRNAVVAVHEDRFGHGHIRSARVAQVDPQYLRPIHTGPRVSARPENFVPTARRGVRPPDESLKRPVVATRPPHRWEESAGGGERNVGPRGMSAPEPRLVKPPQRQEAAPTPSRPPFGQSSIERPTSERRPSPPRPQVDAPRRPERGPEGQPGMTRQAPSRSRPESKAADPSPGAAPAPVGRPEASRPSEREGQPSTPPRQTAPGRSERGPEGPPAATRQTPSQPRPHEKIGGQGPAAPRAPAPRAVVPPSSVGRPEAATPRARSLPGEPANRLAPNRGRPKGEPQMERQASPPEERSNGGRGNREREQKGR